MSNKSRLQELEANTFLSAGRFGRAVKRGNWAKAAAIAGGITAGVSSLAQAKEVSEYEPVADELRRASLMVDDIAAQVASGAQTAALEAYANFLTYLPVAHERLGHLLEQVDDEGGLRGGNKNTLLEVAAGRAVNLLGLG